MSTFFPQAFSLTPAYPGRTATYVKKALISADVHSPTYSIFRRPVGLPLIQTPFLTRSPTMLLRLDLRLRREHRHRINDSVLYLTSQQEKIIKQEIIVREDSVSTRAHPNGQARFVVDWDCKSWA